MEHFAKSPHSTPPPECLVPFLRAEALGIPLKDLPQWPYETLELLLAYADGRALAEWEHSRAARKQPGQ